MESRGKRKRQNKLVYLWISCRALTMRLKIQEARLRCVIIVGDESHDLKMRARRTKREEMRDERLKLDTRSRYRRLH